MAYLPTKSVLSLLMFNIYQRNTRHTVRDIPHII